MTERDKYADFDRSPTGRTDFDRKEPDSAAKAAAEDFATDPADSEAPPTAADEPVVSVTPGDGPEDPALETDAQAAVSAAVSAAPEYVPIDHPEDHPSRLSPAARPTRAGG